jgi:hypothetical protein
MIRAKACACAAGVLLAIVPVDPGDYTRVPGGTDLLLGYYQHLTADDLYVNGEKVLDNLDLTLDVGFIRYLHYFAVGDWLIVPDVILPFTRQEIDLTGQTLSGVGDLTFGTTFSPLLDLKNNHQFGVSLWLTAPTGEEKKSGLRRATTAGPMSCRPMWRAIRTSTKPVSSRIPCSRPMRWCATTSATRPTWRCRIVTPGEEKRRSTV